MRFLADECCDAAVIRALRNAGHDVLAMSESQSATVDHDLMERALEQRRILLTEDKDFGWLVYAGHMESPGVILIRFPHSATKHAGGGGREICGRLFGGIARSVCRAAARSGQNQLSAGHCLNKNWAGAGKRSQRSRVGGDPLISAGRGRDLHSGAASGDAERDQQNAERAAS